MITRTSRCLRQLPKLRCRLPARFPIATCSMSRLPRLRRGPLKLARCPHFDSCAPAHFDLSVLPIYVARAPAAPFSLLPSQLYLDHSHCPVLAPGRADLHFLAALPSTRAIETRLLPSALAATHRGFAFYVAFPKSSIPSLAACSMSLLPLTPLIRSFPRSSSVTITDLTVHLARSHGSIVETLQVALAPAEPGGIS
jgi:hypothetical protein